MRAASPLFVPSSRRQGWARSASAVALLAGAIALVLALLVGLAFAGSRKELAEGTRVAGVEVGGLTKREAVAKLDALFASVSADPVIFVAADRTYTFAANQLAVEPDWSAAVAAAGRAGDGFGPIRGFRRLRTRFFGAEVFPRLAVSNAALEYALDQIATEIDRPAVSAALVRHGLRIEVVPARAGRRLDRDAAAEVLVRTLGQVGRPSGPTSLPVAVTAPPVTARMLTSAARRARIAVSGPVHLKSEGRSWRIPRGRMAELLSLPKDGGTRLAIGGPAAAAYFRSLSRRVGRPPADARFAVSGDTVGVVPARDGVELNVPETARALLRAAIRPTNRVAYAHVSRAAPARTTSQALAMGIDRRMGSYKTYYAGTADRITNLRLGVKALDDTLVPPGGTFSLNQAIGERTAERGFRPAPVIIGTEYAEEVGGGTSQVATTVFNAAWEAGLEITERNPHALYISRYPLGRDATVYWPSLDLKFVNDTKRWLLVKGFAESDGIRVAIYGGESRRVESSAEPLTVTGPVPRERVKDPTVPKGRKIVEAEGFPPTRTSATRKVYAADGTLIRSETWTTSYKGETRIVRVGTKALKPEPKPNGKSVEDTVTPPPDRGSTPVPAPTRP